MTEIFKKIKKRVKAFIEAIKKFSGEYANVAEGKKEFQRRQAARNNVAFLRRNIHRLEKGLIMEPRRPMFASDFYASTAYSLFEYMKGEDTDEQLIKWGCSVLSTYFNTVKSDSSEFAACKNKLLPIFEQQACNYNPYHSIDRSLSQTITYKDLLNLSRYRRSVRWFEDKPVDRDLVTKALEVGLQSPSACNRQPFEFYYFDEEEKVRKIAALPPGTVGFSQNFPAVMIVVGDFSNYEFSRDRHLPYIDASLAVSPFLLALETLGLGSCVINWPDISSLNEELNELVGLPAYKRVVFFCAIGHARKDGGIAFSAKKPWQQVLHINKFKQ